MATSTMLAKRMITFATQRFTSLPSMMFYILTIVYDDAATAIDWLCRAFGFEVRLKVEGEGGRIEHSELVYEEALVMVGQSGDRPRRPKVPRGASPRSIGGANTQSDAVR